jgi:hypothetical protein
MNRSSCLLVVIPAKAGIQGNRSVTRRPWTAAFAGVTREEGFIGGTF